MERPHPPRLHHRLHHTSQDGVRWEWQVGGASREVVCYLVTDHHIPRTAYIHNKTHVQEYTSHVWTNAET